MICNRTLRDSGILHSLLGLDDPARLAMHPAYGASWEGFALEQTLIAHGAGEAYFYRTQRGAELDLMLLRGGRRWGFEFKCSDAPRTTKSMHIVMKDLGLEHLRVVYPGDLESGPGLSPRFGTDRRTVVERRARQVVGHVQPNAARVEVGEDLVEQPAPALTPR